MNAVGRHSVSCRPWSRAWWANPMARPVCERCVKRPLPTTTARSSNACSRRCAPVRRLRRSREERPYPSAEIECISRWIKRARCTSRSPGRSSWRSSKGASPQARDCPQPARWRPRSAYRENRCFRLMSCSARNGSPSPVRDRARELRKSPRTMRPAARARIVPVSRYAARGWDAPRHVGGRARQRAAAI